MRPTSTVYELLRSCLREAHNTRRRDAKVEVDLVVGWLDGEARNERDCTEGDDDEAGAGGDVPVVRVRLELGLRSGLGLGPGLAETYMSLTCTVKPVGAPSLEASSVSEYLGG
tara:strand:- start:175 stop:513 length:339 start_codon:yes stop_codon:yes gene_type:complete